MEGISNKKGNLKNTRTFIFRLKEEIHEQERKSNITNLTADDLPNLNKLLKEGEINAVDAEKNDDVGQDNAEHQSNEAEKAELEEKCQKSQETGNKNFLVPVNN